MLSTYAEDEVKVSDAEDEKEELHKSVVNSEPSQPRR